MTIMMIPSEWRDEIKLSWLTNCDPPEYKSDLTEEEEEAIDKRYHDWEDANIEIYQYSANGDIPLWLARRLLANRKCTYDEARRAYDPIKAPTPSWSRNTERGESTLPTAGSSTATPTSTRSRSGPRKQSTGRQAATGKR